MKRLIVIGLAILVCARPAVSLADDVVLPQALADVALYRDVTGINFTTNIHYTRGASMLMTNMTCYATADLGTNSVLQALTGVTVAVASSTSSSATGTWSEATVQVAANGTWWIIIPALPESSAVYWQCRLTDSYTNTYYYQMQMLHADPHL